MNEPEPQSLHVVGPRKRGRPRVRESQERLSTRLPVSDYDRLVRRAAAENKSLSALVRDVLRQMMRNR